jgi:hypothetical protein
MNWKYGIGEWNNGRIRSRSGRICKDQRWVDS